jgi:phosphate transport system protein
MREKFSRELDELHANILRMGAMVGDELKLAQQALETLDTDLAHRVFEADEAVNEMRYAIEKDCITLIATQQPAAGDLRTIVAVMSMIVDLERMGDHAKGIAKVIPHIVQAPKWKALPELKQMGDLVGEMLKDSLTAYDNKDMALATQVAEQDDEVDGLYAQVFSKMMEKMAKTKKIDKVEARYETLRVARVLERFGDLTTNIAERVIFQETGRLEEMNIDQEEVVE